MPPLRRVASYERIVAASLDRAWENVRDWEHLPWLHHSSFQSIELIEQSQSGWRARIGVRPASEIVLELVIEPDGERYVSRTLEGPGAGSEIWTTLAATPEGETSVSVHFDLPDLESASEQQIDHLGAGYRTLYTRLWDEDEAMMRERASALMERAGAGEPTRLELGAREALDLPCEVTVAGHRVRIIELDGELSATSMRCPHWLGPLEPTEDPALVQCPWHGYRFDLRTGRSCDGRGLRMQRGPQIETNPNTGGITLVWN